MFDGALFFLTCFLAFLIGVVLNKGLSSTNMLQGMSEWQYDIPYIFTIGFNEMIVLLYMTIAIFTLFYIRYSRSESSRNQIKEMLNSFLKIEILVYSFVTGTWWSTFNLKFLRKIDEGIYIIIILGIMKYSVILYNSNLKKNEFKNDLYESRERLLKSIDFNIKNSTRFSIVGEWGIGKTKLIDNFFKGSYFNEENGYFYRDEYEQIYLDVSSYGNNQKIIGILERELNRIFKEAKILKLNRNLAKEFFNISTNYIDLIKKIFIKEKTLGDSKDDINKKIEEYQIFTNKKLVICIDNLERIGDKERIVNLLSVVDEILSDNITRIYLYEEKHMEKLFGENEFKKYIEKYSELKIKVNKIKLEEIIKTNEELFKMIHKYTGKIEKILLEEMSKEKLLEGSIQTKEMIKSMCKNNSSFNVAKFNSEILEINKNISDKKEYNKKILKLHEEVKNKLFNPRYLVGMRKFMESKYMDYSVERLFEYKLILDVFSEFDLNDKLLRAIFFENQGYEYIKKEEELNELYNGKIKKEEETIEGKIETLKIKCRKGFAKDLFKYIEFCMENNVPKEKIVEILGEEIVYTVNDLRTLMRLVEIEISDGINLNFSKNFKIEIQKNFFSDNKKYSKAEAEKEIKIMMLLYYLKKIQKFIRYIYIKEGRYNEVSKLFEKKIEEFKNELKNNFKISFDKFIDKINNEFAIESSKENSSFFKIVNKEELEKEFLILNDLNIILKQENLLRATKLTQVYFDNMFKNNNGIRIKSFIVVKKLEIIISDDYYGINEVIDKSSVEFYLQKIGEIKNNIEAEELLVEIYFLEERIRHSRRHNTNKLKKYYKNN
ncbi:P-loop NTPase fold protein [Cetobacterium somerae]|uniref:P-loop NTPase fold protein n=1 Tax=Cetobacterium somerae TaxID=188913 RepID=UPI00248EE0DB|nr:P-loop NTPase fold protein [Cetobacterium somerae]